MYKLLSYTLGIISVALCIMLTWQIHESRLLTHTAEQISAKLQNHIDYFAYDAILSDYHNSPVVEEALSILGDEVRYVIFIPDDACQACVLSVLLVFGESDIPASAIRIIGHDSNIEAKQQARINAIKYNPLSCLTEGMHDVVIFRNIDGYPPACMKFDDRFEDILRLFISLKTHF